MDPRLWTFAKSLQALGYETAAARCSIYPRSGRRRTEFEHEFPKPADYLTQSGAFLEKRRDRPFCLYFCPTASAVSPPRRLPLHAGRGRSLLTPYLRDTPQVREHYARYLSETSKMDQEIGRLLAALERSGEIDRTVIAYMTDHGPSMHRAKFSLYDWGCVRACF
ncbi:MAG: sulfatase-like hydrolase/transferase [Bryobacterales bacterium]